MLPESREELFLPRSRANGKLDVSTYLYVRPSNSPAEEEASSGFHEALVAVLLYFHLRTLFKTRKAQAGCRVPDKDPEYRQAPPACKESARAESPSRSLCVCRVQGNTRHSSGREVAFPSAPTTPGKLLSGVPMPCKSASLSSTELHRETQTAWHSF